MALSDRPIGVSPGTLLGCDTSETLNEAQYKQLAALGFRWIARYVPYYGQAASVGIQSDEFNVCLNQGLGLFLVQFARQSGWSSQTGHDDGELAAASARALGIPVTTGLCADMDVTSTAAVAIDYLNGWSAGAIAGGQDENSLCVYFEPGVPISSEDRYGKLVQFHRYWQTAASSPSVATRGECVRQLWPGNRVVVKGLVVDYDVAHVDYLGDTLNATFGG